MKSAWVFILILLLMAGAAAPLAAGPLGGSSWYIGFGAGSGGARGEGELFHEDGDTIALPLILNFGAGVSLHDKVALGFDYISFSHFARYDREDSETTEVLSIDDFFAALMFFPGEGGAFVKLGAGLAYLGDWDYDFLDSTADFYTGMGVTAGGGYFFTLSGNMKLGLHAEYSYHRYSSGPFSRTDMAALYVSLYWF
jgi:hypothetical protein